MKRFFLLACIGCVLIAGCNSGSDTSNLVQNNEPLSVEEWKMIEGDLKYAPETLDRLKASDPKLNQDKNWERFMRDVVVPERRKDIPTDY